MSCKINSRISLVSSVYESFHQKVNMTSKEIIYITRFNWV